MKTLENIYQMKDNKQIIDYLEYLLERDNWGGMNAKRYANLYEK